MYYECSAYPALVQTLCEIFGIMYSTAALDSDSDSPSSMAERARVVKGGIEGVLSKKNTNNEAIIYQKDSTSARDGEVPTAITETEPWIESNEHNVDDEGLVVADLIAVGLISRLGAGAADSDYDNDIDLSDVPCAAAVEYITVTGSTFASPSATAATGSSSGDACAGSISDDFRDVDCHAYQDVEEGDVVVEAEAIDVDVEVEVEGMCVGTLVALDDDSTLEIEGAESSCILEAETVHTGPLGSGQGAPFDPDTGIHAVVAAAAAHGSSLNDDVMLSSNSGVLDKVQCQRKGGGGEGGGEEEGEEEEQRLGETKSHWPVEFVMSWNRRIAESAIFFDLMLKAGFSCEHKGKCVYSFTVNTAHRP